MPLFVGAGIGLALFGVWWETALAERIPPSRLSRVSSYDWMMSLALLPIGYLLAGPLGESLGSSEVLAVGSVLATAALAAGAFVRGTWTYTAPAARRPPRPSARCRRPSGGARGRRPSDCPRRGDHTRVDLDAVLSLDEFEPLARPLLPAIVNDYVAGGAWDEQSLAENVAAWRRRTLRPRVLVDVTGASAARAPRPSRGAPVAITATAGHGELHPDGELATMRAAAAAGMPLMLSTFSSRSLEEVAAAAPEAARWFQLYLQSEPGRTRDLVERAAAAGYEALVITVDTPVLGYRQRERRHERVEPDRSPLDLPGESGRYPVVDRRPAAAPDLGGPGGHRRLGAGAPARPEGHHARRRRGARGRARGGRDRRLQPRRAPARPGGGARRRPRGDRRGGRGALRGVGGRRRAERAGRGHGARPGRRGAR